MSFHAAQTFTFGEQPSATKWQYIWDNDYALADGTGISNNAILTRHITDLNVTTAKLAANAVTAAKIEAQAAWIAPTLLNGWVVYGGGFKDPGYMKDSLGFVHLTGMIKSGTANTTIFTLPAGYRPTANIYCAGISNGATTPCIINIAANGTVTIDQGGTGYISISSITFKAEA